MTSSTTATLTDTTNTLGNPVPPFTPHAISVSLPTWRDVVGYETGEKRVVDSMVTGYPRFYIHQSIRKLASICLEKFGTDGEQCLLVPSRRIAEHCRNFLAAQSSDRASPLPVRLIQFVICPEDKPHSSPRPDCGPAESVSCVELHIVLFPSDAFPLATKFWQHTGLGISSRLAERCLSLLPSPKGPSSTAPSPAPTKITGKLSNRHYSVKPTFSAPPVAQTRSPQNQEELSVEELGQYVEERYGRNLPITSVAVAKRALRRRIAGVLVHDDPEQSNNASGKNNSQGGDCDGQPCAGLSTAALGPSARGVESITEDDVYLFPTGMSAIWSAHQLALRALPAAKSVCFGFPYTDTLKTLQKWGPGCHFFGHGLDSDIDSLEELLKTHRASTPSEPAVLALFTEFPSNPLLRSANLPRLRALADKYNFLIVVDETVGNFINVEVLPYADIVVSSLTKVFSGDSNVMGGSMVLNPRSRHYATLKADMAANYEDTYFGEDAIFMERNSRDFKKRIRIINDNANAVCDLLYSRRVNSTTSDTTSESSKKNVIKEVFYPKWNTRENYDLCVHPTIRSNPSPPPHFGGLFSVTFTSLAASAAFFDNLHCHKGPSLGTSFTLACPYTVLAHFAEMDWAGEYGVEEELVRVSVGMEDTKELLGIFEKAVKAAEEAEK